NNSLFSSQPTINADGTLTYTAAPDASGTATVTVKIHDNGGTTPNGVDTSTNQTFTITINAVNDVPSFNVQASHLSSEDAGPQSIDDFATNISAGPTDEVGQAVNFIVTNDNNGLFSSQPTINADGTLTYTAAPNANGTATVTVKIHDNGGTSNGGVDTSTTQTFTISVYPVNDAPSFNVPADHTSNEDAGAQSINDFATNISAGPADESGQAVDFIVTNDNNGLFSSQPTIDADGNLTYTAAPNANGTATVTVKIHDNGGTTPNGVDTSTTQTFTITINAVNDAPSFTVGGNQSSNEDAGAQSVTEFIDNFSTGPADESGQIVNYIVTNDNNSLFSSQPTIDANGNLTYTAAPNANGTAIVSVKIHDNGGTSNGGVDTSTIQTFTITINAVDDAPVANDAIFTLSETATVGTAVGTATATDPDSGDTKTFAITGGNTGNTFAIDPATGVITVLSTAALNFDTNPTFSLQITVTDGDSLTDTATVTVNLTRQSYVLEVHLPSDPATFYIRHGETVIDPAANAYDLDNPLIDYRGGQLSIRITTNAQGNDRLSIISQGTGAGQISVKGKDVSYGGVIIGRITQPGTGLKALTITFNNNVTEAAANALMKVVAYKSTVTSPSVAPRTVTFTIQNAADTEHASSSIIVNVSRSAPARGIQVGAGPVSYNSGTGAVAIAPAGTVISPANLDFNGARLKIDITSGSNSQNRLGINNVGGITVVGKNVLFNGNTIGTATLGNNSVSIKLSSVYATPEAVQALVRAISFSTTAANTNLVNRVASF
ncbi:MAG: Ig-like domain-containing protein, partial [Planctomycetota bacterium]